MSRIQAMLIGASAAVLTAGVPALGDARAQSESARDCTPRLEALQSSMSAVEMSGRQRDSIRSLVERGMQQAGEGDEQACTATLKAIAARAPQLVQEAGIAVADPGSGQVDRQDRGDDRHSAGTQKAERSGDGERQPEGESSRSIASIGDQAEQAQPAARHTEGAGGLSGASETPNTDGDRAEARQAASAEGDGSGAATTLQAFAERMGVTPDKLIRMTVKNDRGEELGEIAHILRDRDSKLYMLIETPAVLGLGDDLAAVRAGDFSTGDDGTSLILPSVTEDELADMAFDATDYDIVQ